MLQSDEVLLTLVKLRQGLQFEMLADIFGITRKHASVLFRKWLKILSCELKPLLYFPPRSELNVPICFQQKFKNIRTIIDCTEIFIEKPSARLAQAVTWSDYKKHNTIKYLVAITPRGTISFVSPGMGGRTSDKCIVKKSGFYDHIEPGDLVMADKGFLIEEELVLCGARLAIPPGKRGQSQMTKTDVCSTKRIANLRIHVERAIKRIKEFNILQDANGLSLLLAPHLDDIMIVCAALCNLQPPLVA